MNPSDEPPTQPAALRPSGSGRRKLLQGAAPILMTLASRPVLGAVACASATAGTLGSNAKAQQPTCTGQTASYWANNVNSWPAPFVASNSASSLRVAGLGGQVAPGTLFHSPTTGFNGTMMGGKPLSEVLQMPDGGVTGLAKHCAVALLNSAAGRTPPLTQPTVRALWNDTLSRGYYEPTAGKRWYADDIVRYIKSTIG